MYQKYFFIFFLERLKHFILYFYDIFIRAKNILNTIIINININSLYFLYIFIMDVIK